MKRKTQKKIFALLQNNSNICNEHKKSNSFIPRMRKVIVKAIFIIMLSIGMLGTFTSYTFSGPDDCISETQIKEWKLEYGEQYTFKRIMIDNKPWILVLDPQLRIYDAFPEND